MLFPNLPQWLVSPLWLVTMLQCLFLEYRLNFILHPLFLFIPCVCPVKLIRSLERWECTPLPSLWCVWRYLLFLCSMKLPSIL